MCKISIIVPVYNAENSLVATLNNIREQSLEDVEIICVDDGSTDNSSNIIKKTQIQDKRIYNIYQKNQGAGVARNKGISVAKGEYIAFMDADDFYPNMFVLEKLYLAAKRNQALICGGSAQGIGKNDRRAFEIEGYMEFSDYQFDFLFARFIFKRSFLNDRKIVFPNLRVYEDPIFLAKALIEAKKFFVIKEAVYTYTGSHQIQTMNLEKIKDYIIGITQSLYISSANHLERLHRDTFERLDQEVCYYAEKYLYEGDKEILNLLLKADVAINRELIGIDENYHLPVIISMWNAACKYMRLRNIKPIKKFLQIIKK